MEKKKVDLKIEELEQRIAPGVVTLTIDPPGGTLPNISVTVDGTAGAAASAAGGAGPITAVEV